MAALPQPVACNRLDPRKAANISGFKKKSTSRQTNAFSRRSLATGNICVSRVVLDLEGHKSHEPVERPSKREIWNILQAGHTRSRRAEHRFKHLSWHGSDAACLEFVDFSPECAIGCAARERAVRQSLFVSNKPALAPILPRVYWGPPPS